MTTDEITEMARESQLFDSRDDMSSVPADYAGSICLFAELVAAKEREACAVIAEKTVCDTHIPTGIKIYGTRAAKSIRARCNP